MSHGRRPRSCYAPDGDIAYISVRQSPGRVASRKEHWGLSDYDNRGRLIGIEIWQASSRLPAEIVQDLPRLGSRGSEFERRQAQADSLPIGLASRWMLKRCAGYSTQWTGLPRCRRSSSTCSHGRDPNSATNPRVGIGSATASRACKQPLPHCPSSERQGPLAAAHLPGHPRQHPKHRSHGACLACFAQWRQVSIGIVYFSLTKSPIQVLPQNLTLALL